MPKESLDLRNFCRQLDTLVNAGIPLHQSLDFMIKGATDFEHPIYSRLLTVVESGYPFSTALAEQSQHFPRLLSASVKVAEETGRLHTTLTRVNQILERRAKLQGKMRAAFTYPLCLSVVTISVVFVLVFFVLPREAALLSSLGKDMPFLTRLLSSLGDFLGSGTFSAMRILLLVALISLWRYYSHSDRRRDLRIGLDRFLLRIPVLGDIIKKACALRLLYGMASLFELGASWGAEMSSLSPTIDNSILEKRFEEALVAVRHGTRPSKALAETGFFPRVAIALLAVAEEDARFELASRKSAEFLELELESTLETLATLMEPLALFLMGLVVGIVVVATALPTMTVLEAL